MSRVDRAKIRCAKTPREAKKYGRRVRLRKNWEEIKLKVMFKFLNLKFRDGNELAKKLLATGDVKLIEENWWGDIYWGVCNGEGSNYLGRLLMKVRKRLVKNEIKKH